MTSPYCRTPAIRRARYRPLVWAWVACLWGGVGCAAPGEGTSSEPQDVSSDPSEVQDIQGDDPAPEDPDVERDVSDVPEEASDVSDVDEAHDPELTDPAPDTPDEPEDTPDGDDLDTLPDLDDPREDTDETPDVCAPPTCVECTDDEDCDGPAWCDVDRCVASPVGEVSFERFTPEGLEEVSFAWSQTMDLLGFGPGMALLDTTGTGRLDLFVGRPHGTEQPACIYRNVSAPGSVAFEPMSDWCDGDLGRAMAGWGVDLDGDGVDELLLFGQGTIEMIRFAPELRRYRLEHPRLLALRTRSCLGGAVAPVDLTGDGRLEVVVGCQAFGIFSETLGYDWTNLILRQTEDGGLEVWDDADAHALLIRQDAVRVPWVDPVTGEEDNNPGGNTLALAVLDLNDDGLQDVVLVNDAFSTRFARRTEFEQGYLLLRQPPDAETAWEPLPFAEGSAAWGAYMGAGQVRVAGRDALYLSDWGANRLLFLEADGLVDEAVERGVDLERIEETSLFSWGVVVDDFTGDGADDIVLAQGAIPDPDPVSAERHRTTLFAQTPSGRFRALDNDVGFSTWPASETPNAQVWPSPRGMVRADLDGSGAVVLVAPSLIGQPYFYRVVAPEVLPAACQLDPRPSLGPGHAAGFALAGPERDFHVRDVQGQMRMAPPRTLLTRLPQGWLRFPSGYEMPFTCSTAGERIVLEEPTWIELARDDDTLLVTLSGPRPGVPPEAVEAAARNAEGQVTRVQGERRGDDWIFPLAGSEEAWMFAFDGRWTPRWLAPPLQEAP